MTGTAAARGWDEGRFAELTNQPEPWDAPTPLTDIQVPPFPTSALPEVLRDFVEEEATATQTPTDVAGMLVLALCAAAVAQKAVVRVRESWLEPLNLWTVVSQ